MCFNNFVSLTKTMVVMMTMNENPMADVVMRDAAL
jgi:hypothetical protein